jgi:hypothetical protein
MTLPANQTLPLADFVTVSLSASPVGVQVPNVNTVILISSESPSGWAGGQTYAVYISLMQVATDWGLNSSAYAIAQAFFSQTPNPVDTQGYLVIAPRLTSPSLETIQAAITRLSPQVFFFGVLIDVDQLALNGTVFAQLAAYCQANTKMLFYTSMNPNDLNPGSGLDLVRQAGEGLVRCLYYGTAQLNGAGSQQTQIFSGAYAARGLSTNFAGANTSTTLHGKQLVGVLPDQTLTQTAVNAAQAAGVDVYGSFGGFSCLYTSGANTFFDQAYQRQWLAFALQVAGFNYLAETSTKVPQTEDGMNGLKNAYIQVLKQAVANGYLAAGLNWQSSVSFGNSADLQRNITQQGFYVYSLPIAQQSEAQRQLRAAPVVQIAAQEGGAIHSSSVIVNVEA